MIQISEGMIQQNNHNHNHNGNHNRNGNHKQQQLEWRRSQVLKYSSEGHSQREIASKLGVDLTAVNRDLQFLRQQSRENIQKHIQKIVPEEYQKCMVGMKSNLKRAVEISESVPDYRTKLEAIRVVNECYKIVMDLCSFR
jgi:DNA-binding transcriptional regulator LsrR (DeoR family)